MEQVGMESVHFCLENHLLKQALSLVFTELISQYISNFA